MKKPVIGAIICLLILSSCMSLFMTKKCEASVNAIYVDNSFHTSRDGSAEHPYEKIQYAIDLADPGDTIYVFGGTYNETLVINKNITLMGSIDKGDTIITRNAKHRHTVEITADYATLESFTISDPAKYNSFALVYIKSNNVVLQGNNITHSNTWGIYLYFSDDNTISNNIINDTKGVYLYSSNNNVFSNDNFTNCQEPAIEMAFSSGNNIIYNNDFDTCKYSILAQSSSNNNISENTIISTTFDGVKLSGGINNILKNNRISDSDGNGIDISSSDSKIIGNIFNNNQIGILLGGSNCHISNNCINNSKLWGIYTTSVSNSIIYLNRFFGNYVNALEGGNNKWYYGTQGNYWDDYDEIDIDLDKIGDTPYSISGGGQDVYPLGYFLKPPAKPDDPSPSDGAEEVGLFVTLSVTVTDPDSDTIDVRFYSATDDEFFGTDYMVPKDGVASCHFNLPFVTTFLWYAVVTDGKLENRSNIWIFNTKQIPPLNKKPVADPGGPYTSMIDKEITFDGSESSDQDGSIDFYRWNFGDGSSEILDIYPEHIYSKSGTYTIALTVVDNDGRTSTETTTVTISASSNVLPVPVLNAPNSSNVNELITFGASSSYDTDGTIANYTWNFGDGSVQYGISAGHIYSTAGTYTVMLTVTDDDGDQDTTYAIFTVIAPPEESPGFEIILAVLAMAFILFCKKRRG